MLQHPGFLFVIATLLPLASFVFLLLVFALRSALRPSREGSTGAALYEALGGDTPQRWPALVATMAIGVAFVFSLIGFVWYSIERPRIEEKEVRVRQVKEQLERERGQRRANLPEAQKKALDKRLDQLKTDRKNEEG